jgi:hypothetical protein
MLFLVQCVRFVWFVQEKSIVSNGEVVMFSFVGPCRPYIPCNSQDDFHHRGHTGHHSIFFSLAMLCQMVTCAFHASRFEMAIIFSVPISLTVILSNIPFVFRLFEFYFALLYVFYIEYSLVIRSRHQFYKKHGKWSLSSVLFNIPDICLNFSFDFFRVDGVVHIL